MNTTARDNRQSNSSVTPTVVLLALTAVSVLISLQGWRSRLLHADLWLTARSAEAFVATGKIPDHGCLSSLRSYIPPGTNLMFIPGVLLFRDERLFEFPGAGLLHLGALIGLFFLCRLYFSDLVAYLSVVFYAISALGLRFSTSLWPRGHPFFAVWFFYFLGAWHIRKRPYYLACALFTWAVGMYYFMELAPLILAIPIVYFARRSQISKTALAIAVVASILVWTPYLQFEAHRDFRDVASQLSRKTVPVPAASVSPYPILNGETTFTPEAPRTGILRKVAYRFLGGIETVQANFIENAVIGGSAGLLFALCVCGLSIPFPRIRDGFLRGPWSIALILVLGIAGLFCLSAGILAQLVHHPIHAAAIAYLSALGANLLAVVLVGLAVWKLNSAPTKQDRAPAVDWAASREDLMLFASCVVVAWGTTIALVDDLGLGKRIWWAWPIQIAFIVFFLASLNRRVALPILIAVFAILAANPVAAARLRNGVQYGWSGKDPAVLGLLDTAVSLQRPADPPLSVGYLIAFPPWLQEYWKLDNNYKVGSDYDMYLSGRYKQYNSTVADYGIGKNDRFVIVQTAMKCPTCDPYYTTDGFPYAYVTGVPLEGYRLVRQADGYSLLQERTSNE